MFCHTYYDGVVAMKMGQRVIALSFVFILFYLFVLQIKAVWPFTIDDMYISLRYAKHWWEGYGLVWNVGELPVEGYSNFSFVLLARLALSLGYDPIIVLKGIGGVGLFYTCFAIYAIARMWFLPRLAIIPCLWLLMYKGQILWSVSGLETTIYQALICSAVFFIFHGLGYCAYPKPKEDARIKSFIFAAVLLAAASVTRPEAPALMLLFSLLLFSNGINFTYVGRLIRGIHVDFTDSADKPRNVGLKKIVVVFLCTFLCCFAPYFLWRLYYYGRLFPNPVYCKGLAPFSTFVLDKQYLQLIWPFALLTIPALWRQQDSRYYFLGFPSVLYLLLLIGADPIVAFDNRLFLTAFALLLPLALLGMSALVAMYLPKQDSISNVAMYVGSFLLAFFFIPMFSLNDYRNFTQNPIAGEHLRQDVVRWLKENIASGSKVVLADSGLIPYKSSYAFIDSYCLNNREMTRPPMTTMYERLCKQVINNKSDVIILTSLIQNGKTIYTPTDACLAEKLSKAANYCLQANLSTGNADSSYRYEIYRIC
jgi:hypothetical protein